ncbi:hypothetical protein KST83_03910 [Fusobacterium nucleatum]|uniref:Uncharacterized protein n=1 Tax=Fusobacterium nucleatum subsp. polymorphum TaxID=76857 RepID=A0A2C6B1S0_FUSNP|nr:hypothetical protein [Fusobacterium polymorphum]PHH97784.1 hypothetical protein CA840_11065 [Fusobacterium polymorphum]
MEKVFTGYHGTVGEDVRIILNDILKNGFRISSKNNEWLGRGIYFFDNINNAHWWNNSNRKKELNKGIIKAEIFSKIEYFLDLDDEEDRKKFKAKIPEYKKMIRDEGVELGEEDANRILACLLLNLYSKEHGIKLLRKTFSLNNENLLEVLSKTQTQYCVTDNSNIRKKEICYCSIPNIATGIK